MLLPARLLAGSRSLVLLLLPVACAPEELPATGDLGALEVVAGIEAPRPKEGLTDRGGPVLQDPLEVAPIQRPLRAPYTAEALAGEVQDLLTEVADRLLHRDVAGLGPLLHPDFLGQPLGEPTSRPAEPLPLGARRVSLRTEALSGMAREAWLAQLDARLAALVRVTHSEWALEEAQFERGVTAPDGAADSGVVEATVVLAGEVSGARLRAEEWRVRLRVERADDAWSIQRLVLRDGHRITREGSALTEVTRSSGVHHVGPRYGRPGNDREGWHGAGVADVDGDGALDIVVPGPNRLFLYRNDGAGGFTEEAEVRGLGACAGATGLVLADLDADGDPDLALAGVGWSRRTRQGGTPLRLLRNDGAGRFEDVSEGAGLGRNLPALGLTTGDLDGDGLLDLYVCGYGRMEAERNDNWLEATNGAPDRLLLGNGDLTFRDATEGSGIADTDWTVGALPVDADRDGIVDLVTLNHFGPARAWRGLGAGRFEQAPALLGGLDARLVFGGLVADLDRDGLLDLYLSGASSGTGRRMVERASEVAGGAPLVSIGRMAQGNRLLRGDGKGFRQVEATGAEASGWSWGTAATDLDLDGHLDLVCVNGFVTGDLPEDT